MGDKLPPGAVAVDDSPNLPPGAVAVQDEETPTAPPAPKKEGFWSSAIAPFVGAIKGLDPRPTPEETQQGLTSAYDYALRPFERTVSGQIEEGKKAVSEFKQAAPLSLHPTSEQLAHRQLALGHGLATAIPVLGPWAASTGEKIGEQVGTGDISGAVGTGVGNLGLALAPKALGKVATKLRPAPTPVSQASALASVLARTPLAGDKQFIPQQVAADTVQHIRQAAADNPAVAKVATKGNSLESFGATNKLMDEAIQAKEREFDSKAAPALNQPVDAQPALNHLYASDALRIAFPDEAEFVDSFYNRLEQVQNLKQLNDLRKILNEKAEASYKDVRPDDYGKIKAYRNAADALRNLFYDEVQRHTGEDLRPVKRTEGALLDAKYAIRASTNKLTSEHQKFVEPNTPRRLAAKVLEGVAPNGNLRIPVVGYAADRLRGSSLDQIQDYWKKALSDLPPPTPAQGPAPVAPVPPNRPKLGPGGPGSAMQTAPPGPVPGQPPPSSVSYPNPAGVGAPAPVPQMGTTPGYQLPSGPAAYAGPNTVNPSTARTQVAPTLAERTAVPPVAPPPGTGLVVGPDGTVTIPRKMLAAPAKVGDIINFQGKKMQVAKVFKDGQTALKEVTPPKAPKGKKGNGPVAAIEPYKSPAQMTDEWSNPNQA